MLESDDDVSFLDVLEDYADKCGWQHNRHDQRLLSYTRVGEWQTYAFLVTEPTSESLLLTCSYQLQLPKKKKAAAKARIRVYELLNLVHENMPHGTWAFTTMVDGVHEGIRWAYRFRHFPGGDQESVEALEQLLDTMLEEVDDYYPAILRAVVGDCTAQEAFDTAIPNVYGHA